MKSAIEWLMGKSESLSINNNDLGLVPVNAGSEHDISSSDKDSSKENSILNGHFSGGTQNRSISVSSPLEKPSRRSTGEEARSPWGRTLTPKSSKYISQINPKSSSPSRSSSHSRSVRMSPPISWEDMSFASDVMSPGFTSRIAKEARGGRKLYDGSRRYPIGQEKFIRGGILPNVRLKGRSKPVIMARRAPTSPLIPLASSSSPFSSSSLASGFLASATTRMPDISSVVSVLDSTPSTSACEVIKDPTSVQAVVAALEQAQNIKSGMKRSRYGETEDSNKKQKCSNSSLENINDFASPIMTQAFSSSTTAAVGVGGGEKRALDQSPPSNSSDKPQLSPENKRRCVPDPRFASFSSSKNLVTYMPNTQISGRETPFSMYESHQDSDSESNKSLESHQSRHSERSFRVQNHDPCRVANQEPFDRSGSETPQSVRGSYGLGASNGSSSSSRTTTPSKPSHVFSLEAYKADKAKSHQRLNKMLGMLFNVSDDENDVASQVSKVSSNCIPSTIVNNVTELNSEPLSSLVPPVTSSHLSLTDSLTTAASAASTSGLLKEAFANVQPELSLSDKTKENGIAEKNDTTDVSTTFTFTLKPKQDALTTRTNESEKPEVPNITKDATSPDTFSLAPSSKESINSTSIMPGAASKTNTSVPLSVSDSNLAMPFIQPGQVKSKEPDPLPTTQESTVVSSSFKFPPLSFSSPSTLVASSSSEMLSFSTPLETPATLNFNSSSSTVLNSNILPVFSLGKFAQTPTSDENIGTSSTNLPSIVSTANSATLKTNSENILSNNMFKFGSNTEIPIKISTTISGLETSLPKPSLGIFTQSSFASTDVKNPSSSGLFPFAVSNASTSFNFKDKESSVSATSQPGNSPFTFGASLPSSNTSEAIVPSFPKTTTSNLFNFGSSHINATNNGFGASSAIVNSATSSEIKSDPMSSGFNFNPSRSDANKASSGFPISSSLTSSNSIISSSNNNNIFSFGSNTFKPSGSDPLKLTSLQTTTVSSPSSSSGVFSFGDGSKLPSQKKSSPFAFGATTTSSSIPTPAFGGSIGGGFSFGGVKSPVIPQFGSTGSTMIATTTITASSNTTAITTSSSFNFNNPMAKPQPGFDFSTPKGNNSTGSSNIFTFGNANASPSMFGTATTTSGSVFSSSTPKPPPSYSFGAEKPTASVFNPQSPPPYGAPDIGNKNMVKPMFGSNDASSTPKFGATNPVSPFNIGQNANPFKPLAPTFGGFGGPKTDNKPSEISTDAPNQNLFQSGQNSSQNAPFTFGQSGSNLQPSVFQFGSQGSNSSNLAPTFGSGVLNFGGSSNAANFGGNNAAGPVGANIFTVGTTAEQPPGGTRRLKARPHRRR